MKLKIMNKKNVKNVVVKLPKKMVFVMEDKSINAMFVELNF